MRGVGCMIAAFESRQVAARFCEHVGRYSRQARDLQSETAIGGPLAHCVQEHELLARWREQRTFERLRAQNANGPHWSFLDGPITANNPMGVHHAWGRTLKDVFQRYYAAKGHDERYQNGFDCQGLWIEVGVEREVGLNSKREIEEYGLEPAATGNRRRGRPQS